MKYRRWNIAPEKPEAQARLQAAGYPYLVSAVLAARGVESPEQAAAFLEREDKLTLSPFLMKDMDKAAARLQEALARQERIAVFGDYDVDGITATCILVDYLKRRGADVVHYIPRRIEDGYGLSCDAIQGLYDHGVRLLVTVDCGITGVEEVDFANRLGLDVVITDHHECREELPHAVAVVDPHRADCTYPFKHLAGCGVALKLVLAMGGAEREASLFARYCTLAAIGTVADVMQMSGENRTIVSQGLSALEKSDLIGLHALLREAGLSGKEISSVQIGFILAPRINAAGRMGEADKAAELLLCDDPEAAERMAKELCALNRERQNVEQEIYVQAEEMIGHMPTRQRSALVLESSRWHQGVVGIVASRLSEKYSRPSFMIHLNGRTGKGSCRSWGGFNLFAALESCKDLLLGFGGHELAAGFTIDRENIPAFRERMNEYARSYCNGHPPEPALEVDAAIAHPGEVTLEELEALSVLEPYGSGNARPLFCLLGATLLRTQNVGQNRHLKLRLGKGCAQFDGIFFSTVAERCGCAVGDRVDAAFYLQINEFRGNRTVQLQMVDIRPSLCASGREQEALTLVTRCAEGEQLSQREARRVMPTREQFAAAWRFLERAVPEEGLSADRLPLLRHMAAEMHGAEPFLHAAACVAVFRERGLLEWQETGDAAELHLCRGKRVSLEQSPLMASLRFDGEKGGGAL